MKHLHFLFSITMSLCVHTVCAQSDSTLQLSHELQRVDVVADRPTSSIRTTIPQQQLNRQGMLKLGTHTLTDALRHMAGITLRDYGGAGGLKTVSVRGIGARHTAVVYDGIALSDCQTGEIDLSRYSLNQLASVSLTIGDNDDIFQPARNQAAAATLYLETHPESNYSPPSQGGAGGGSSLSLGSFGMINPSVRLVFPPYGRASGRGLSFSAIGELFHADNDYPFTLQNLTVTTRERRTNSRMDNGHGEINLLWQPTPDHSLSAKAYYYKCRHQLPGIVHYYTNENHERLDEQNAFGQLRFHTVLSSQWALRLNAKYNWSHTDYQNRTPGSGIGDAQYWQREAYASASILYTPAKWLSLDYAADFQENSLNSTLTLYRSHPHRTMFLQCVAGKAQWPRLTVVARGLATVAHNPDGKTITSLDPSMSMSYQLLANRDFYARLMFKRIFRMPTFNELYFYHIGTADLQPERTSQLNVGLTGSIPHRRHWQASITADLFMNKVTDNIVAVPFNMFVWRIQNLDRATIIGTDITAHAAWLPHDAHTISFNGNYSWQRAMNGTVKESPAYHLQLPYTPMHSFCSTLSWENPWLNASSTISGQSCQWTTAEHSSGTRIAGFTTFDLSFWRSFSLRSTRLTLRATLQNLLDKQYDLVAHYPMPGRSATLQTIIKY